MNIQRGIGETFKSQAAEIYWDAFKGKLGKVLGPDDKALPYFAQVLDGKHAITACDGDRLLGIAGYDLGQGGVFGGGFVDLWRSYGVSAFWRGAFLSLLYRVPAHDTLQMDGIAVAKQARGQGVGTALLCELYQIARMHNMKYIGLDVIDSNPRARALYEREGFVAIGEERLGLMRYIFGFRSATKMRKIL